MTQVTNRHCETMSGRERLLTALHHKTPDRVPIDLGGNVTGIHKFAYEALLKHLGVQDRFAIMDNVQQLAQPCEAVLEQLHVDTRDITAKPAAGFNCDITKNVRDGRLWHDWCDEFGVIWSMPDDRPYYMDPSYHPLAEATVADIADYPFPKGDDPSRFEGLHERALAYKKRNTLCGGQRCFGRGL